MTRMPETPRNLPDPANRDKVGEEGRVLRWPHKPPETRVPSPLFAAATACNNQEGPLSAKG